MDNDALILLIVGVIAIIASGALFLTSSNIDYQVPFYSSQSSINLISNNTLSNGDDFEIMLIKDDKGEVNKPINVTFFDGNGNPNSMILNTDNQGIAKITLNGVSPGNYTVKSVFIDDNTHVVSSLTSNLEVR